METLQQTLESLNKGLRTDLTFWLYKNAGIPMPKDDDAWQKAIKSTCKANTYQFVSEC